MCINQWIYEITISNKVYFWHLVFDSNSTNYVAMYAIPIKWLKFHLWITLIPSFTTLFIIILKDNNKLVWIIMYITFSLQVLYILDL